jgi:hypothetical protein
MRVVCAILVLALSATASAEEVDEEREALPPADAVGPALVGPGASGLGQPGEAGVVRWRVPVAARSRATVTLVSSTPLQVALAPDSPCRLEGEARIEQDSRTGDEIAKVVVAAPGAAAECLLAVGAASPVRISVADGQGKGAGRCEAPRSIRTRVDSATLAARTSSFLGKRVAATGRIDTDAATCTLRECPGDGCCNACSAGLRFPGRSRVLPDGTEDEGHVTLDGLTCSGNECTVRKGCPFEPGSRVTVWGVVTGTSPERVIEVEGACAGR